MNNPPEEKRRKMEEERNQNNIPESNENRTCKFFVIRKKRFCKMTVAKGKEYCGEHLNYQNCIEEGNDAAKNQNEISNEDRIECPLDPKHTVYRKNLKKHLKICNARVKDLPKFITPNINGGSDDEEDDVEKGDVNFKLSDVNYSEIEILIGKIENFYNRNVRDTLDELILEHSVLNEEIGKMEYGHTTRKHLIQASSILGILAHYDFLEDSTSFIELGSGKAQLSFWLSKAIESHEKSQLIPIDIASHRHKKDNKVDNLTVKRIRANIRDLNLRNLDLLQQTNQTIAISKHLCGEATDLALRCILMDKADSLNSGSINLGIVDKNSLNVNGFLIAFCCHHRCTWKPFLGKKIFLENGFSKNDFILLTKMASWAICGNGYSRERRKLMEEKTNCKEMGKIDPLEKEHEEETTFVENNNLNENMEKEFMRNFKKISRAKQEEIGRMCKRIMDYCRMRFMSERGFDCSLKYYVNKEITLENVCIVGKKKVNHDKK